MANPVSLNITALKTFSGGRLLAAQYRRLANDRPIIGNLEGKSAKIIPIRGDCVLEFYRISDLCPGNRSKRPSPKFLRVRGTFLSW